jgi:hypothetical protein
MTDDYGMTARIGQACNVVANQWLKDGDDILVGQSAFIDEVERVVALLDKTQKEVKERIMMKSKKPMAFPKKGEA